MTADYLVSFPGLGIGPLEINRVAFSIGNLDIYWYGLLIAFATILSFVLALQQRKRYGFKEDDILDLFLVLIPTMLIGARLYYVAFAWDHFADNPAQIFNLRDGGLAFYGGVIGAILGIAILASAKKIHAFVYYDYLAPYVPLAQGIGRWGNFFNQEAFGVNTDLPWGMISNGTKQYLEYANLPGVDPNLPVHPTFFYEFLGNIVIAIILFYLRRKNPPRDTVTFTYLGLYGLLRFFVEGLRTDALFIGNTSLRISQVLSLVMMVSAILYFVITRFTSLKPPRAFASYRDLDSNPDTNSDTDSNTDSDTDSDSSADAGSDA